MCTCGYSSIIKFYFITYKDDACILDFFFKVEKGNSAALLSITMVLIPHIKEISELCVCIDFGPLSFGQHEVS